MPNIRTATSRGPCDCPADGYQLGSDVAAVDIIDGNPAEYGVFTANIADFGFDRDDTAESADLRTLLGLPDPAVDSNGDVALYYKYGSGIKVGQTDAHYDIWKPYRYDCGCNVYTCAEENTEITSTAVETIPCFLNRFIDEDGELDFNCDQVTMIPVMVLNETVGVGDGTRMDGDITNMLSIESTGIPASGSFKNYVDSYGIIHSARWAITGDVLDITFTTKDPRIPGLPEQGRIVRNGKGVRVFKTGIITVMRQLLRVVDGGYVILGQGVAQSEGEFQTTFGCGDVSDDPFIYHYNNNVLEQLEFIIGTTVVQDPEDSTAEFEWWPTVLTGTNSGFKLFDGGQFGPVSTLSPPSE